MIPIGLGLTLITLVSIINAACYLWLMPNSFSHRLPLSSSWRRAMGDLLHAIAYELTIFRIPFSIFPYLVKACLWLLFGPRFEASWRRRSFQVVRGLGDLVNWGITSRWLLTATSTGPVWLAALVWITIGAEAIRLVLEKGQMLVSLVWQALPHRRLATGLQASPLRHLARRYIYYYRRNTQDRFALVHRWLRGWAARDNMVAAQLSYVRGFRIVPSDVDLSTGLVRDIARGEILVHERWSNDPWLLVGQALRRGPWLFDPRHLRRPFYYRTDANPRATRFVLQQALYTPPFALYQLGHEIKAARFELFFRITRALGMNLEALVCANGAYRFDPLLTWLSAGLSQAALPLYRPLWTEAEALSDLALNSNVTMTADGLAAHYNFPLSYVNEVLLPAALQAKLSAAETASGASQCG